MELKVEEEKHNLPNTEQKYANWCIFTDIYMPKSN